MTNIKHITFKRYYFYPVNKLLSIVLILSLSFPGLYNFGAYLNYELNIEAYIAQCINTDNETMKCNGRCHLKTELIKDSANQEQNEAPVYITDITNYIKADNIELHHFDNQGQENSTVQHSKTKQYHPPVFHPPTTV